MTVYLSDQIPMKAIIGKVDVQPITSDEAKKELTAEPCEPKWEYNRFGHVTIRHCDCSDTYLQVDTDVEAFFDDLGINPETLSAGDEDTLKDDPYFEGECKRKLLNSIELIIEDKKALEEIAIQLTGKKETDLGFPFSKLPKKFTNKDTLFIAQPTPPGPINYWKVNIE